VSALALAAGFSLMVAAYGVAANRTKAAPKQAQAPVGTLKAVLDTIDYLDPQQAYTGQSWWAMWDVWETLLTYRHVDGPGGYKLVPGLAASLPSISANGKVYKFKMRKGLKYSNGAPIRASDFEYAIKRGFLATGQGVGFYTDIAGAAAFAAHPTAGGRHLRHHREQLQGNDHHQDGQAARRLPDHPGAALRRAGAGRDDARDPQRRHPGLGPVPHRRVRPEPRVHPVAE